MKSIYVMLTAGAVFLTGLCQQTSAQTASEVLGKAIAFYDPGQKWTDYSGRVNLSTTFANGRNSGGEIIEIQTKEGFYQCTKLSSKAIFGLKNGKLFREVDGNKSPDQDMIKKFGMSDETIHQYQEWHYFHFGILPELQASGLVLNDKVETVKFQGNDCLVLQFNYDAGKLKNEFYKGSNWTVYIDPADYSMKGFREAGLMNIYAVFSGILNLNGLKIPLCRTYFNNQDNSFYMTDVFTGADDNYSLSQNNSTKSFVTASNIGLVSIHLLNLNNEEALEKLREPLKEINEVLAEIGFPECGYIVYKVTPQYESDYTHIMEGLWDSEEVYELTHNHPKYKEVFERSRALYENAFAGRTYFRVNKMMPDL